MPLKRGSVDERREGWWIKASYIWYHPVTSISLQYLVLSTIGPGSLKSFFSLIGDRATGTVHLVCYWEHTQSNPPMHTLIFKVCVWLRGWLWSAETCSSLLWENFCHFNHFLLSSRETEVETKGKMRPLREHSTSRLDCGCLLNRLCVCVGVNRVLSCDSCGDCDLIFPSLSFYLLINSPTLFSFALITHLLEGALAGLENVAVMAIQQDQGMFWRAQINQTSIQYQTYFPHYPPWSDLIQQS